MRIDKEWILKENDRLNRLYVFKIIKSILISIQCHTEIMVRSGLIVPIHNMLRVDYPIPIPVEDIMENRLNEIRELFDKRGIIVTKHDPYSLFIGLKQ